MSHGNRNVSCGNLCDTVRHRKHYHYCMHADFLYFIFLLFGGGGGGGGLFSPSPHVKTKENIHIWLSETHIYFWWHLFLLSYLIAIIPIISISPFSPFVKFSPFLLFHTFVYFISPPGFLFLLSVSASSPPSNFSFNSLRTASTNNVGKLTGSEVSRTYLSVCVFVCLFVWLPVNSILFLTLTTSDAIHMHWYFQYW